MMMMMMMVVEQSMECEVSEETEVLREILPQCHFVHHKSHMTRLGAVGNR
jgi:coenzyme F420-reducing hydrogenase alpha subunit